MIDITDKAIDLEEVRRSVSAPQYGAILLFVGITRNNFEGRDVLHLEYEAYRDLAISVMEEIARDAVQKWPGCRTSLVHRTGVVPLEEASVVLASAAAHRDECYQINRFLIEALKARVPVWKKEVYADGTAWKENTTS
jgi:molybdopterin synthase catalytic subunit